MSATEKVLAVWGPDAWRRAIDSAGLSMWLWNVDTNAFQMDGRGCTLWDVSPEVSLQFEHLSDKIHPADRDRVRAAFLATRTVEGSYEIDFRTLIGSTVRWISARGLGSDEGMIDGSVTGVFLDVTGRKQAQESSELLAGEMSHRVRNVLSIASVLARITSRTAESVSDMTEQLMGRLTALGRAHDLARPLPDSDGDAVLLGDIFSVLLAPYDDQGAFAGRIRLSLPRMGVGAGAAVSLAMMVHELATNSAKYGALSTDEGTLDVSGQNDDNGVEITWAEHGGPELAKPSDREGYGSTLLQRTVEGALGGSISYEWPASGLIVTVRVNPDRLAH